MYNMIIVDDETTVRNGLKVLLEWEKIGFTICAEGTDGMDGLEKILKFMPELVLIDLKMPGLGGIEVIQKAREAGFKGEFIILTGYSDFEFAKSAISLGVKEYLLKPIDEDELEKIIIKLKTELDERVVLSEHISENEKRAKEETLRQLLLYTLPKEKIRESFKGHNVDFNYEVFSTAVLSGGEPEILGIIRKPSTEFLAIMRSGLERNTEALEMDNNWVLICKGRSYKEMLEKLLVNNERLMTLYGRKYFISMGHDVSHYEDLHYSYECATMLLEYRFSFEKESCITIEMFGNNTDIKNTSFCEMVCPYVEIGDIEGIDKVLSGRQEEYRLKMLKETEIKLEISKEIFLLNVMLEERYPQRRAEFPVYKDTDEFIKQAKTLDELTYGLKKYLTGISAVVASASSDNVVKRVYLYLEKNYSKEIKLEAIAKMFNYNSAYLGKIFKKEMGESFNNVLDNIRIENAKKLLSENGYKVYQVSEKVGYSNIDYFYSKFKKYVGISPKEYQKLNSTGREQQDDSDGACE